MGRTRVDVPRERIADLCQKWRIRELSLFGSVLRGDFGPDSDVDVLVEFEAGASWSLFDLVDMADELTAVFGREVDVVEKACLKNPFRRHSILTTPEVVYAA